MLYPHIPDVGQLYMLLHFRPGSFLFSHLVKVIIRGWASFGYQQDNH
jgi:hypothetical protein